MDPYNKRTSDGKLMVDIISMICDYAKANGYEPDETLRTVANNILSFLSIASLNEWIGDMDEESD
jgi:hypothetical protein